MAWLKFMTNSIAGLFRPIPPAALSVNFLFCPGATYTDPWGVPGHRSRGTMLLKLPLLSGGGRVQCAGLVGSAQPGSIILVKFPVNEISGQLNVFPAGMLVPVCP